MDLQMPVMGGIEATMSIRERELARGGHLRIIAMTAHATIGDRERCVAAGMDDYLTKPIDSQRLYAAVERLMPVDVPGPAESVPFNRADVLRRLDGDEDLLAEIIRLFLDDSPELIGVMRVAAEARDRKALRTAAHRLKGAAANLAATSLAEAARALEVLSEGGDGAEVERGWRRVQWETERVHDVLRRELARAGESTRTEP